MNNEPNMHLLLEEYKSCRMQILENIKWMDKLEVYTAGGIAAIYVFMFTLKKSEFVTWVAMVPFILSLAAMLRSLAIDRTIKVINDYLVHLESKYPEIGFTTFYRRNRFPMMKFSRQYVWILLIGTTTAVYGVVRIFGPFWL
ncbi:MAG: hypothetical protein QOD40_31 [Alphaproteobacteria bacterium]|jgi:hypothetical protein|nr:hypothetical protein [Alphaproteobacteria bacterium]